MSSAQITSPKKISVNRKTPLVTVVICVYNAGKYLRPSLLSVLNQSYCNLDIIVVDDGSTDGCFEMVGDLLADGRIRVLRQGNSTKPVALNRALNHARGEFYAVHDADDISHPRRIERQLAALLDQPELAAVYCGNDLIINGRSIAPVFAPKTAAECKRAIDAFRMPAHDPTGMYRISLVGHLRYDTSLPIGQGLDYILRIGERHPIIVLGECLYSYRILRTSNTRRDPVQRERLIAEVLKHACNRRGLNYARIFPEGAGDRRRSKSGVTDNNIAGHFIQSVLDQARSRRRLAALRTGIACVRLRPLEAHYYKALVYALVSSGMVGFVRRMSMLTKSTAPRTGDVVIDR
jgi:glycosyltransferase involved in cell wall biosynthesis